ncbi:LemA protein [Natranaerovirga hydrolytica]|uniref:LemA protein n=1 Tax=Natranaerovirga hydrolytica TaxID=680378 RepID=A0A4R1ML48_9FIRM|nr:LemA family protein [Natranaerovirga hydrolytica]TCK92790.1 LemA protein [Natranaerovirga hydrolytica]
MKTSMKVLIGIGAILLIIIVNFVSTYNGMVTRSEDVRTAYSEIDNQLQRRNDLIPNLVDTAQRYMQHEEDIFTSIADARAQMMGAGSIEEQAEADVELNNALSRLIAVSEAYPDLRANENFINLQDELAGTENRIAEARRTYNNAARNNNSYIRRFPANIYRSMFGFDFEQYPYFEAAEGARENPNVGDLFGN